MYGENTAEASTERVNHRGGADSDILMKPVSECSEKPGKMKHKNPKIRIYPVFVGKRGIRNRKSGFSGS